MRNHLAEECLNSDMLHLMKQFKESLCENSSAASLCDGPIKLLEQTSRLIAIFHDRRSIADLKDERLEHLSSALLFFPWIHQQRYCGKYIFSAKGAPSRCWEQSKLSAILYCNK